MATDAYALKFIADIEAYQRKFSEVEGFTDKTAARAAESLVKRMSRAQEKAAAAAERAARKSEQAWKQAGDRAGDAFDPRLGKRIDVVGDKAGDLDTALAGVAGVLDRVNPELGSLAMLGGDAAGGLEAVVRVAKLSAPGLLAVGTAAVVLGGAYLKLRGDLEEAEEAQEAQAATAKRAQAVHEALRDVVSSVADEYRLMVGEIDQAGLQLERRQETIAQAFAGQRRALEEQLRTEREARESLRQQAAEGKQVTDQIQARTTRISGLIGKLEQLDRREEEVQLQAEFVVESTRAAKEEAAARSEQEAALTEALRRRREEEARLAAGIAELEGQSGALAGVGRGDELVQLITLQRALRDAMSESDQAAAALADDLQAVNAAIDRVTVERVTQQSAALREEVDALSARVDTLVPPSSLSEVDQLRLLLLDLEQQSRTSAEAQDALAEPIARVNNRLVELEDRRVAEVMEQQRQATMQFATTLGTTLMGMGQSIQTLLENSGGGARKAEKVGRALATAQVLFSGAQAAMAAFSPPPVGLGPVAGGALAAAMGIQTGLQIAAINTAPSVSMHSGGTAPDEIDIRALRNERLVSPAAMDQPGLREAIDRAEAGRSVGGQAVPVFVDGHRIVAAGMPRALRRRRARQAVKRAVNTAGDWSR